MATPSLEPLRSRFSYVQGLRPFGLEDTRNYVRFHLDRAETPPKLFSDPAIRQLFNASAGRPRSINQLAVQALIQAAVHGRDEIDGRRPMKHVTIPPHWTGEEALSTAAFLEKIIRAIWRAHGAEMAEVMMGDRSSTSPPRAGAELRGG